MFSTVKIVWSVRHSRMHSKKQFKMSWTVECNSVSARKLACTRFLEHDGSLCCEVLLIQIKSAPNLQQFERSTKAFNTSVLNLTQTKTQKISKSRSRRKEVADFVVILHVSLHYTHFMFGFIVHLVEHHTGISRRSWVWIPMITSETM